MDRGLELTEMTPVGRLAATSNRIRRRLDELGIDYCCHGERTLAEASRLAGRGVDTVLVDLRKAGELDEPLQERDWAAATTNELLDHIIVTYHDPLREQLENLGHLAAKVGTVHGATHGSVLRPLGEILGALTRDLVAHLNEEERQVFPLIRHHASAGAPSAPSALDTAVEALRREHVAAGQALETLRGLTDGYAPPAGACASFRALYQELARLERELHDHVHLENNVVFPRLEVTVRPRQRDRKGER